MEPAPVTESCAGRCGGSSRRGLLLGLGLAGVGGALAACGGKDGGSAAAEPEGSEAASGTAQTTPKTAGTLLGAASSIPVGGGVVFKNQKIIVTQPTKGVFKAWSNVCTHSGCAVDKVAGGTMNCPCHGSKFAIADAKVVAGPAPSP
ncbi:MAG: Rieske (2Fe-2S) protein, partial [Streptosporangiaceae bacterium]